MSEKFIKDLDDTFKVIKEEMEIFTSKIEKTKKNFLNKVIDEEEGHLILITTLQRLFKNIVEKLEEEETPKQD